MACGKLSITLSAITKKVVQESVILLILFATVSVPTSLAQAQVYFRDGFNYKSIADLQSAGWQVFAQCTPSAPNGGWPYVSVGSSEVTIVNDGSHGTSLCHDLSGPITDWSTEMSAEWVGGSYGTLALYVYLAGINYGYKFWVDDYFGIYEFDRLGVGPVWTQNRPNLQPQTWYTLMVQKQGSTISLYFDGVQVYAYQETDPNFTSRFLARIGIEPGWLSTVSFDNVEVGSPTLVSTLTSKAGSSSSSVSQSSMATSFTTGTILTNGLTTVYTIPQSIAESAQLSIYASMTTIVGTITLVLLGVLSIYLDHFRKKRRKKRKA